MAENCLITTIYKSDGKRFVSKWKFVYLLLLAGRRNTKYENSRLKETNSKMEANITEIPEVDTVRINKLNCTGDRRVVESK